MERYVFRPEYSQDERYRLVFTIFIAVGGLFFAGISAFISAVIAACCVGVSVVAAIALLLLFAHRPLCIIIDDSIYITRELLGTRTIPFSEITAIDEHSIRTFRGAIGLRAMENSAALIGIFRDLLREGRIDSSRVRIHAAIL